MTCNLLYPVLTIGSFTWPLFTLFLVAGAEVSAGSNLDSLGTEKQGGSVYVLHEVESKETLYSLSRRYGAPVSDIKKANPTLSDGLKIGQTIRIPQTTNQANSKDPGFRYHTVTAQQTLYSIAATYQVTIDQLRNWNHLTGNELEIGQDLIVGETMADSTEVVSNQAVKTDQEDQGSYAQVEDVGEKEVPETIIVAPNEVGKERIVKQENGFTEILENGLAEVIENSKDTRKYLALHKTAPVGTILQIKNEMNSLRVFVRVIGQLPDTGNNDKVLLKISRAAYDRLGAIDPRFPVVVTYFL